MNIAIGADHAGFLLKQEITEALRAAGHTVVDKGTDNNASTDYPDYAEAVARDVAAGSVDRGILVCSTGTGMVMAANKIDGVRAALAVNAEQVQLTRQHNDANVLALGAKFTTPSDANQYVNLFLQTPFEGGRHQRRVDKISQIEKR